MYPSPPRFARLVIEWLCSKGQFRDIPGDLHEEYVDYYHRRGPTRANYRYILSVLKFLRPYLLWNRFMQSDLHFSTQVIRNSIKTGFRNLRKEPLIIGAIVGLTLGFSCCLLIFSFISTELSYDRYHKNADRIYRIIANLTLGETPNMIASTNTAPAMSLKEELPGVLEGLRLTPMGRIHVEYDNRKEFYEDRIYYSDETIFKLFDFRIREGRPDITLSDPNTIVLTESSAKRYFGDEEPIGKTVQLNGDQDYEVVGVVGDVPHNSHFYFDMLVSFSSLYQANGRDAIESWLTSYSYYSYVLLSENQDADEVEAYLSKLAENHLAEVYKEADIAVEYFLQPVSDIHLHSDLRHEIGVHGDIKYIFIFGTIAFFVLVIASLNFVNLTTARFSRRVDDVVIRKILGADRKVLIMGLLVESITMCLIAMVVAIGLTFLLLPVFSEIAQRSLNLDISQHPQLIYVLPLLPLGIGLLAGLYPAVFLSSWKPAGLLRKTTISSKAGLRRVLVVVQFAISIVLIICTGLILEQQSFLMQKELGFQKEKILVVPIFSEDVRVSAETIKNRLKQLPGVANVSGTSHVMGQRRSGGTYQPEGLETVMMDGMSVDYDFLETMGMQMVQGRNFSREFPSDPINSILINEAAARELGWLDPLGKKIKSSRSEDAKSIVGVVKDFHFKSPHIGYHPIYISLDERPYRAILIKLTGNDIPGTVEQIEKEWETIDPNRSLDYYFLDGFYNEQYHAEQRMSAVFSYFTLFALLIACMGLAGMASFVADCRTKEIGIRKVVGASVLQIIYLLSRSTISTLLWAFIIGSPIAYFGIQRWLENFKNRIDIGIEVFIISALVAGMTAILTVALQSMGVARSNPVNSLRSE